MAPGMQTYAIGVLKVSTKNRWKNIACGEMDETSLVGALYGWRSIYHALESEIATLDWAESSLNDQ